MTIWKAGIHRECDVSIYHADPCERPSLSQSIAKILIDYSPLHATVAHPRLVYKHPEEEEAEKYNKAKAIGDAAHALMIGRGKLLAVAPFDAWRSDKAKDFRADAEVAGKTPILEKHFNAAHEILRAAQAQLEQHEESNCFKSGSGEVALIWQEGDLWFRCLVDWLHEDLTTADDMKTTAMSVAPHVLGLRAADAGWEIQAAMIERGLNALDDRMPKRRTIRFVAIEQEPPYALNVMRMNDQWLAMGRKKLEHAIGIWSNCVALKKWPGYPPYAVVPEYPSWKESQWLNREIHEAAQERKPMLVNMAGG